jgi:hypothetical protein
VVTTEHQIHLVFHNPTSCQTSELFSSCIFICRPTDNEVIMRLDGLSLLGLSVCKEAQEHDKEQSTFLVPVIIMISVTRRRVMLASLTINSFIRKMYCCSNSCYTAMCESWLCVNYGINDI